MGFGGCLDHTAKAWGFVAGRDSDINAQILVTLPLTDCKVRLLV